MKERQIILFALESLGRTSDLILEMFIDGSTSYEEPQDTLRRKLKDWGPPFLPQRERSCTARKEGKIQRERQEGERQVTVRVDEEVQTRVSAEQLTGGIASKETVSAHSKKEGLARKGKIASSRAKKNSAPAEKDSDAGSASGAGSGSDAGEKKKKKEEGGRDASDCYRVALR